jgi:hypothetical protein
LLESSDEANLRKILDAQRQVERRNNEAACLSEIRKQADAQRKANQWNIETSDQAECRKRIITQIIAKK